MPIRKRKATRTGTGHSLRHPLLKHGSMTAIIYRYIDQHPGCRAAEVRKISSSGQPLTDLVNAGLVRREGTYRAAFRYFAMPENETGPGRDILEVEIRTFINQYGEYSIAATLRGQMPRAAEDFPRLISTKNVKISVPSSREGALIRETSDIEFDPILPDKKTAEDNEVEGDLIIEGEYTIITPSQS